MRVEQPMPNNELSRDQLIDLLERLLLLSWEAGVRILQVYDRGFSVETKTDDSPVTEADMAAHEVVVNGLQSLSQAYPVLSEESVDIPVSARSQWETYWLVDPLDGTREFIKRNGEFTVNIALIHKHEAILGVVYAPVADRYYYAARDCGAFKREGDGAPQRIHCRKADLKHAVVAGGRSHAGEQLQRFLQNLNSYTLKSMGSSLKSCLIAEGAADIYPRLGLTSEWDTAAAQCILEQAGGHIQNTHGERILYNTKESLLNPFFLAFGDDSINWSAFIAPGDDKE